MKRYKFAVELIDKGNEKLSKQRLYDIAVSMTGRLACWDFTFTNPKITEVKEG